MYIQFSQHTKSKARTVNSGHVNNYIKEYYKLLQGSVDREGMLQIEFDRKCIYEF